MSTRGMPKTRAVRQRLRKEAEQRQAEYDGLSVEQKLAKLPPAPSAQRQRARLEAQLNKSNSDSGQEPKSESKVKKAKKQKISETDS